MEIEVGDWVLVNGQYEAYVLRPDHFKNGTHVFVSIMKEGIVNRYIPKTRITKLDPALYPFLESEYERIKSTRTNR